MSRVAFALSALLACAAAAEERIKVMVLNLTASEPALQQLADSLSESVLTEIQRSKRLSVVGQSDVASMLGIERQKQLLGCAESECVTELANALGVEAILLGSVAKLGTAIQLDAKLVNARDASVAAVFSKRVDSDALLLDAMTEAAKSLAAQLAKKLGITLTPLPRAAAATAAKERRPTTARKIGMWMMIGGAAVAVGAFVGVVALTPGGSEPVMTTPTMEALVATMFGGLAVTAIGLVVFIAGGTEEVPVQAALIPVPGGGVFSLATAF